MIDFKGQNSKMRQKVIAVIGLFCVLLFFCSVTVGAAGSAEITVSSCSAEKGTSASLTLDLKGNPGIWGLKLRIHYDSSALALNSVTAGGVFSEDELTLSQDTNKNPYVIVASSGGLKDKTRDGTLVTLNFTVSGTAEFKDYAVTAEVSQANNVHGDKVNIGASQGSISVVSCVHADKEWRTTKQAKCEETGEETLTCKKCEKTFETRTVDATGHLHTEVRNASAATKKSEGYTGDTYCKDCGNLIYGGTVIPKLKGGTSAKNPSDSKTSSEESPAILNDTDLVFRKNSKKPLVFMSNVDLSRFTGIEIDGTPLDEKDYTAEGGNTTVTVFADCLNKLSDGQHTVSIIFETGTLTAPFTVYDKADASDEHTSEPDGIKSANAGSKSSADIIIIVITAVIVSAGAAAAFLIIKRRRG